MSVELPDFCNGAAIDLGVVVREKSDEIDSVVVVVGSCNDDVVPLCVSE